MNPFTLNPFNMVPKAWNRAVQGIVDFLPSLDAVIKVADPKLIPETTWLRNLVDQAIMPVSMTILLFALSCALIQEQRLAASGASDFTKILYRLLFHVAVLSAYSFLFGWIVDATQTLGDLFIADDQISSFIKSMYEQYKKWDWGTQVVGVVALLTYIAAFVMFFIFFLARYMLLALLFVIGPVVIAFSVWSETSRFRVWLVGLIQIASWVVVFKFIIAVSMSFALDKIYNLNQTNVIFVIAANMLYLVMLWHTPAIASVIIGGTSLGFLGSRVIEIAKDKTLDALSGSGSYLRSGGGLLMKHLQARYAESRERKSGLDPLTLSYEYPVDPYGGEFRGKKPDSSSQSRGEKYYGDPYGSGAEKRPPLEPGVYIDPYGAGKIEHTKASRTPPSHVNKGEKYFGDPYGSGKSTTPNLDPGTSLDPSSTGKTEPEKKDKT